MPLPSQGYRRLMERLPVRTPRRAIVPMRFNQAQDFIHRSIAPDLDAGRPIRRIVLKARRLGMCLEPSTRVLTADLRWREIETLAPGDELIAVDEYAPGTGKG